MVNKIKKHVPKRIIPIVKEKILKNKLKKYEWTVPLNKANLDRIVFVVSRDGKTIKIIDNIRYEIFVNEKWEFVVRYDDHAGIGSLHPHYRIDLRSSRTISSSIQVKKKNNKDEQLNWVRRDLGRNYLTYRKKFLKNCGLDLY